MRDVFPAACACGIGFTVSFLIASLAYTNAGLSAGMDGSACWWQLLIAALISGDPAVSRDVQAVREGGAGVGVVTELLLVCRRHTEDKECVIMSKTDASEEKRQEKEAARTGRAEARPRGGEQRAERARIARGRCRTREITRTPGGRRVTRPYAPPSPVFGRMRRRWATSHRGPVILRGPMISGTTTLRPTCSKPMREPISFTWIRGVCCASDPSWSDGFGALARRSARGRACQAPPARAHQARTVRRRRGAWGVDAQSMAWPSSPGEKPALMEAANRGAALASSESVGLGH